MSSDPAGAGGTPPGDPAGAGGTPPGNTSSGIADQANAAIDQFRSVGKWIITSFAAVAALLLAGVQLTSLGSVNGWHLFWSCVGLGIAIVSVIVAIRSLTSLLEPRVTGVNDVVR